jgi:methyl-accepting chemotaxis protein
MIPDSPYWIGTGVYIDDVQKKKETISQTIDKFSISYLRKLYIALALAFIVLVVPLTLILIRSIVQPLTNLTLIADKFSRGKMNLDIPDLDRRDEIGKLAKALVRLGTSTRLAMQRLSKLRKTAGNRTGKVNPERAA